MFEVTGLQHFIIIFFITCQQPILNSESTNFFHEYFLFLGRSFQLKSKYTKRRQQYICITVYFPTKTICNPKGNCEINWYIQNSGWLLRCNEEDIGLRVEEQ